MRYKVLLAGRAKTVIDDIFFHTNFICQNTSMRYDDIVNHVRYFQPDVFIYCIRAEEKDDLVRVISLKGLLVEKEIPFVLIGDSDECTNFAKMAYNVVNLMLTRPISVAVIEGKINRYLEVIEKKKEEESAQELLEKEDLEQQILKQEEIVSGKTEQLETLSVRRKHILTVDDDPRMLKLVKEYLKEDYDVATAINGKLALKFLETKTTDLVLLDYEMPGQNGAEVLQELRKQKATSNIPIVFLTGLDDIEKVREILKMKPQGYLLKPIDHDKLVAAIKGLIG